MVFRPLSHRAVMSMLTTILCLSLGAQSLGQPPPQMLPMDIISATELPPEKQKIVCDFAEGWVARMADPASKPEDVEVARATLLKPLQGINQTISPTFRTQYSACLAGPLQKVIAGQNYHAAVNAILVGSHLGTDKAVNLLVPLCDKQTEPRWQIRLKAADGCKTLLVSKHLQPKKSVDAAKQLRNAAKSEDNSMVLVRQLEAIDAADFVDVDRREVGPQLRSIMLEAIETVVDRIAQSNNNPHPSPLLAPANIAIANMRDKYMDSNAVTDDTERLSIAKALAPDLVRLLEVATKNFEAAQNDPQAKRLYTVVIGTCEGFLTLLQTKLGQTPQTKL